MGWFMRSAVVRMVTDSGEAIAIHFGPSGRSIVIDGTGCAVVDGNVMQHASRCAGDLCRKLAKFAQDHDATGRTYTVECTVPVGQ